MDHAEHVNFLRHGIPAPGGVWADFGAGRGAFTLALADVIGPTGEIYAVDRDTRALQANAPACARNFRTSEPTTIWATTRSPSRCHRSTAS